MKTIQKERPGPDYDSIRALGEDEFTAEASKPTQLNDLETFLESGELWKPSGVGQHAPYERERRAPNSEQLSQKDRKFLRKIGAGVVAVSLTAGVLSMERANDRTEQANDWLNGVISVEYVEQNEPVNVMQDERLEASPSKTQVEQLEPSIESNPDILIGNVFEDARAERAMMKFGMDSRDFIIPRAEVLDSIAETSSWAETDELLPGHLPAIYKHESTIIEAADINRISPNIVANFIEVETSGFEDAENHIPAMGLGQHTSWMIDNYKQLGYLPESASRDDFIAAWRGEPSNLDVEVYREAFLNPEQNIMVTALHLSDLKETVQNDNPQLGENNPQLYTEMGLLYNGGFKQYNADESVRAFESRNYTDALELLIMQNAVADELIKSGLSDDEAEAALTNLSDEFNASMYAIRFLDINDTHDTDARIAGLQRIIAYNENRGQIQDEQVAEAFHEYAAGEAHLRDFSKPGTYTGKFQEKFGPGSLSELQRKGISLLYQSLDQQ